ncbi:MAG: phosphoribosylformylglycinamidine synthase [Henriciella sp.]|jgi:phosphoribosylformylglycinamidine synthase|uniref:phosphoribosylformylglycinamidine synthase subunit PurS n=1 Tax=Henriciella sp. TaxID=1968823 RepID=UPI000C0D4B09|nr:phosphoribosylformylglycinamidine synthase subunit PurS [Henriciella sp.]MAN73478.1 phosphoribosylformylglycinamidine synthase [Henriciella sp.]MBF34880.1 phosphoribosylformylglycinamidine synthase [Hyphomonadaceae bacterium]MBK74606.1 phosphoribosylformylglycinamidine synthase [Henriciella sp.]PHR78758.1 MAG: phosphoribosylformylglycinamidine synthase [Henriciella sp.]|tara:strand:- start:962 stop:1204 length:243 start_codon:yes stop_codon:yes gene_type:complete
MKAIVHVGLKPGVLDPQGKAVADTLGRMGYEEVQGARIGKVIELDLDGVAKDKADARVKEMCEKLLANTVIESYRYELVE